MQNPRRCLLKNIQIYLLMLYLNDFLIFYKDFFLLNNLELNNLNTLFEFPDGQNLKNIWSHRQELSLL